MGRDALDAVDDVTWCPRAERCRGCDGEKGLELVAVATQVGVMCLTICGPCVAASRVPAVSYREAVQLVLDHCAHLGITADEMNAAMREARR